jgi:predicted ATPase
MKIKKLILKNYKVFDHLELDFTDKNGQVLDTIVLAGLNGTGKTTILELLTDLMNGELKIGNFQEDTEVIIEVIVANECEFPHYAIHTEEKPYFPVLKYSDTEKIIVAHIIKNDVFYKILGGGYGKDVTLSRIISSNHQRLFSNSFSGTQCVGVYILSEDNSDKENKTYPIYKASLDIGSKHIKKYLTDNIQKQVFENIDKTPRQIFETQVNKLNTIFDGLNIESKLTEISDKDLIFRSINGFSIGFDSLSSGEKMLYFMGFMLKSLDINNGVIMIDQPEDALHPKWQQQITEFFKQIGIGNQVILATHSPQIIASVHPESVFILSKSKEKQKIEAFNMATEHKYSFGVEPNRILDEIMGVPARNEAHEKQIKNILQMIKEVKFNLSKATIEDVEQAIAILEQDYGKQDLTIMRLQNEVWLLKRKVAVAK